ncbi:hypothetical protein JCM17823_14080 [Halorubrum gandharaense]
MPADAAHDDARYLTGSPARVAVLRALRERPRRPAALTETVDATRTTVQRILAGFRDRDWVVSQGAEYRLTATGRRVHDAYETLLAEADRADRYGAFAAGLARAGVDIPQAALDEGEITVATDRNPFGAVDRMVERIRDADEGEVRATSPIVTSRYNEAAAAAIDAGASFELVIDEAAADVSAAEFDTATERALTDDNATILVTTEPVEFGLFRHGNVTCVVVHDAHNSPRCLLETTAPTVAEWADEQFAALRTDARPLSALLDGER